MTLLTQSLTPLRATIFCWFFLLSAMVSAQDSPTENKLILRIAVAANFKSTLDLLIEKFYSEHALAESLDIRVAKGSTGALYTQIINGAPFDIFFAADTLRPQRLVNIGVAVADSLQTYALGQLALVYPSKEEKENSALPHCEINSLDQLEWRLDQLAKLNERSQQAIAMANPKVAPYGKAAQELLIKIRSHGANLSSFRIIQGQNVIHSQQFLITGNVDIAFLSMTQAHHRRMKSFNFCKIATDLYPQITQSMVLVQPIKRKPNIERIARSFMQFIQSESAQTLIINRGYKST